MAVVVAAAAAVQENQWFLGAQEEDLAGEAEVLLHYQPANIIH